MKARAANKFEWHLDYYEKQYLANKQVVRRFRREGKGLHGFALMRTRL